MKRLTIPRFLSLFWSVLFILPNLNAQPLVETSARKMPYEWIDKETQHKVIRLSCKPGSNASFYFHNNPFVGNKMVFYSTDKESGRQIYTVVLKTYSIEKITAHSSPDGKWVIFRANFEGEEQIYAVEVKKRKAAGKSQVFSNSNVPGDLVNN